MMSHWQPQSFQYSSNATRMSHDNTRDQSKQILSRERREMLVHYFSHRDATSMSQQQRHPIRQERDDFGLVRHHRSTPHMLPSSEWPTDYYPPVERRRHHTGGQDRTLSVGVQMPDSYVGDSRLHGNQKNGLHYKSCNMIGSDLSAHGDVDHQLYPAKSIHHIPDSSSNSNHRKEKYSSPNLAISSQGLEYICNFKSTPHHLHKVSNQVNECLMHTRSAQDLRTVNLHSNHPTVQSAARPFATTAVDHKSSHRRRRKHKNCLIM